MKFCRHNHTHCIDTSAVRKKPDVIGKEDTFVKGSASAAEIPLMSLSVHKHVCVAEWRVD